MEALENAAGKNRAAALEALHELRGLGRAAKDWAEPVTKLGGGEDAQVTGAAARTLWAIAGDREGAKKLARLALEQGYFDGCADVVRLLRELERQ